MFPAEEILRFELLDELVPQAEVADRVRALAGVTAANAPLTISAVKFAVATVCSDDAQRDIAACVARPQACSRIEDNAERRRAFIKKRVPLFRGP